MALEIRENSKNECFYRSFASLQDLCDTPSPFGTVFGTVSGASFGTSSCASFGTFFGTSFGTSINTLD